MSSFDLQKARLLGEQFTVEAGMWVWVKLGEWEPGMVLGRTWAA